MLARVAWAFFALGCVSGPSTVAAQSTAYQFTMGVTSPTPVPGQPFTITWTGGETTETVYIVLNGYFPPLTTQNIIYTTTDILSNAPNNGSWTYNVPLDISAGRHSFSIGINPLLMSDTTDIFIIQASQTFYVAPVSSTSNTAVYQTYNGCGLPPLPDYTYTGYQPPCTVTTNGHVETLYPIVPASDSSSFFGGAVSVPATTTSQGSTSTTISSYSLSINTAFATGVYAQALQCPTVVTPSTTKITASGTTTVFSLVGCATASGSSVTRGGVCHTSGYTTFSVSGTSSVCCPNGWAMTPLASDLFCFTSVGQAAKRQASTQTLTTGSNTLVEISGLAFTSAGVVAKEATTGTSSSTTSGSHSTNTQSAASASTSKSGGEKLDLRLKGQWRVAAAMGALYYLV